MSGLSGGPGSWPPPNPPLPAVEPANDPSKPSRALQEGLASLSLVLAWFGVAAVIGALVWWQVTPLAEYTRTSDNALMDEQQLSKQFGTDGWFWVIGSVGGLVSGLVLALW